MKPCTIAILSASPQCRPGKSSPALPDAGVTSRIWSLPSDRRVRFHRTILLRQTGLQVVNLMLNDAREGDALYDWLIGKWGRSPASRSSAIGPRSSGSGRTTGSPSV